MYKVFLGITLVVLCLCSGAQAFIGHAQSFIGRTQNFDIGALNRVEWAGGIGSAKGNNQADFHQTQAFSDRGWGLSGVQRERGTLTQTATISGEGGPSTVEQNAKIHGSQHMSVVGGHHPGSRAQQTLGVEMNSLLERPSGAGETSGRQSYTGSQDQTVTTPYSSATQSQCVNVVQSSTITSGSDIDPTVKNVVNISLSQSQMTTGR